MHGFVIGFFFRSVDCNEVALRTCKQMLVFNYADYVLLKNFKALFGTVCEPIFFLSFFF